MNLSALAAQARGERRVEAILTPAARAAIEASHADLLQAADHGTVYGATTGVGALRAVAIDRQAGEDGDQGGAGGQGLRLWRSHAGAFGPLLAEEEVRATMLVRLLQLAQGSTGVSLPLALALEEALIADRLPPLHGYGSIGTGDLPALAQLALALREAAGHDPDEVEALPFLSSNALTIGLAVLAYDALAGLLRAAERVAARSFGALHGNAEAFDPAVFGTGDAAGAVAARMRDLIAVDGAGREAAEPLRVQDPFGLRTIPQVHGAAEEALAEVAAVLTAMIATPSENPLPLPGGTVRHHGAFLAHRLAVAVDRLRAAVLGVAELSQARLAALMSPQLTGERAFLAGGTMSSSGLMIGEYLAADVLTRIRHETLPATLHRTSVSLGLEELASHATQSVRGARAMAALLPDLLAIELHAGVHAGRERPDRVLGDELRAAAAEIAGYRTFT
ncbi:MAG: aromatic amino acid lyase [Nocardioides sp.]|uniref:aromatic amino acid lyase n=1 Tax=Nocardioides sp. TaxID=35761 RepID=UPI0039E213BF